MFSSISDSPLPYFMYPVQILASFQIRQHLWNCSNYGSKTVRLHYHFQVQQHIKSEVIETRTLFAGKNRVNSQQGYIQSSYKPVVVTRVINVLEYRVSSILSEYITRATSDIYACHLGVNSVSKEWERMGTERMAWELKECYG